MPKVPGRPLLMSFVLFAAIAGGLGVAYLISQMRPTINDERRLKEVCGLPILGSVVMDWTDSQKSRRMRGLVAFLVSLVSLLSTYAVIMAGLVLTMSRV